MTPEERGMLLVERENLSKELNEQLRAKINRSIRELDRFIQAASNLAPINSGGASMISRQRGRESLSREDARFRKNE